MFRPLCTFSRQGKISLEKQSIRSKVVRPTSLLSPAQKLKLYNKENKELFGPLLETNKHRKSQLKKGAKNNSQQNNKATSDESTQKFDFDSENVVKNHTILPFNLYDSVVNSVGVIKYKMWQNTKTFFKLEGVMLNGLSTRGLKTLTVAKAAQSSSAQPGYASEDKILQIKQHQHDFTQQYPAVTLILNKTMSQESKQALDKWKQERIAEMGQEEFNKFYQAQLAVGTKFHNTLKTYFTQPRTQLRIEKEVEGVWVSVAEVLKSISSPKAIESNVVHPVLKYRGIFDAIADYEDRPTLIEWKKSDKPRRSLALTYDNPVQLAAYFGAVCHDLNYRHLRVRDALLVVAYTDGSRADAFHLPAERLRAHWAQWLVRLEDYALRFGGDPEKILRGGKRLFEEDLANL